MCIYIYRNTHTTLQILKYSTHWINLQTWDTCLGLGYRFPKSYLFYHNCRVLTSYWPGLFTKTSGTVFRIPIIPLENPCCWMEILRVESSSLKINSKAKIHRTAIFWGDWRAEKAVTWSMLWWERRCVHTDDWGERHQMCECRVYTKGSVTLENKELSLLDILLGRTYIALKYYW